VSVITLKSGKQIEAPTPIPMPTPQPTLEKEVDLVAPKRKHNEHVVGPSTFSAHNYIPSKKVSQAKRWKMWIKKYWIPSGKWR